MHTFQDSGNFNILLWVTNDSICSDSVTKTVQLIIPHDDIAVIKVVTTVVEDYFSVVATIINLGNRDIETVELMLDVAGKPSLKEDVSTVLHPGQPYLYNFVSKYQLTSDKIPEYICVTANLSDGYIDYDLGNNTACSIAELSFNLVSIYPNPVHDKIMVEFILPEPGKVEIEITNAIGQIVGEIIYENCVTGLNLVEIETSHIAKAAYTLSVKYLDEVKISRFVKN